MILKRSVFLVLLVSLMLQAQEGELTLDPNDIPLTPDPTLDVPTDNTNTIQVPNLDNAIPEPTAPVPDTLTQPVAPPQAAPTPPPAAPAPRIEEHKPTPSNLEVKSESSADSQKKEERFSRDYTKFHKDSTSEQNWEKVVGKRTSDTYIVNKGDTLWDISGTLFGDPFYWPKIWSLNKDLIYNPHVIFPDMKIKFYQGSAKAAPTLATDNTKTQAAPVETAQAEKPADPVTPPAPGTEDAPKNVHIGRGGRKLPKYFKDQTPVYTKDIEVQVEEHNDAPVEASITQEFYIAEQELTGVGKVVEIHGDFSSAGDGIYVFIKFDSQPEGTYTILKPGKKLRPNAKEIVYDVEMYETEGEVKVLGKVNTEENVYRAKVTRTNTLVSPGSIAIPGKMKTFKISSVNPEATASKGRIIGNLSDYGTVGQGSFVLINQGSQTGYLPNMSLPIFEELEVRNRATLKSFVKENPQRIGMVTIVDVTPNFSVGYITKVVDAISVNDIVAAAEGGEFNPAESRADSSGRSDSETTVDQIESTPTSDLPPPAEEAPIEEF